MSFDKIIPASELQPILNTEGRCYCKCWKCSALLVKYDPAAVMSSPAPTDYYSSSTTPSAVSYTPTSSVANINDLSNYNQDDEANTLNNTALSEFSTRTKSSKEIKNNNNNNNNNLSFDLKEPIEVTTVETLTTPIKSKSSACFVEDGTIELTTTTESEGNVLHTAVTKINLPDFEDYTGPLQVVEEETSNETNLCETEIITTRCINTDGSVTKTTKTIMTIKKTNVITILTGDGRVLVKSKAVS